MFRLLRFIPGTGFLNPMKWLRRIAALVVLIYFAAAFADVVSASRHNDSPGRSDAIIVLGAAQYNGRPSPVLKRRLDHAFDLYNAKVARLIVVTGGRKPGDRITEASASANYLIARGVSDERIAREVQGTDTYTSMAAASRFLKKRKVQRVTIVTDGYHAARVAAIASELGLDPVSSPVGSTAPLERLLKESGGIAVGRIIGFRRLSAWITG
jgi:uncharacterized SAM-binding protein YcdF (DUF218 family)